MRRTMLAAAILAVALIPAAQAQSRRTVSYFLSHPSERSTVLRECVDDEEAARMPVCGNARRAADRAAWSQQQAASRIPTISEVLASPDFYEDPITRGIRLDQCRRGEAPPAQCDAARAAERSARR